MTQFRPPTQPMTPPPLQPYDEPGVVLWFKVYCVVMLVMYLLVAGIGAVFLFAPDMVVDPNASGSNQPTSHAEATIMGVIYFGLGGVFAAAFLVGLLWRRGMGAWVYGIVLICISFTSCCCLPATVPLLIFWLKPECKNWLMRAA